MSNEDEDFEARKARRMKAESSFHYGRMEDQDRSFDIAYRQSRSTSVANAFYARYNNRTMARASNKSSLKLALKAALIEAIEENRGLVCELFQEALEDVALKKAVREGLRSRKVSKGTVLSALSRGR